MSHRGRISAFAMLLVPYVLVSAACTGEGEAPSPPPSAASPSGEGVVSVDTGATDFVPGRFIYQFNSITAQVTFVGRVATMNVRNGTGAELGAPSLYVIGADDRRYDGAVDGADAIADGEQVTLEFTFPEEVTPQTVGLAVLSFGEDNVGAMAPVPKPAG